MFLAVGTSLGVYPRPRSPSRRCERAPVLAILNGEPTPFDAVADFVHDRLGDVLPTLVERI